VADEQFHQPGNIDLLIGADLFYVITRPGRRTRPGNYPVLQETVLSWTTAGGTPANTTVEDVKCAFLQRETKIVKHQACEKLLHTHNPTQKGVVVDRHPNKRESIPPGTFRLLAKQEPCITDHKLGRGPKLKIQGHNFTKKLEEINQKSVKFQEGTKIYYFRSHHPVSKETRSTSRTRFVSNLPLAINKLPSEYKT